MDSRTTSSSAIPSTVIPYSVSRPKTRFMAGNVRQPPRAGKRPALLCQPELVEDRSQHRGPLRVARGVRVQHVGKLLLLARARAVVEKRPCIAERDLRIVLERLFVKRVQPLDFLREKARLRPARHHFA